MAKTVGVRSHDARPRKDSVQGPPRRLHKAPQTGCVAVKESKIVLRRCFGWRQHIECLQNRAGQFNLDQSVILDRALCKIYALDVALFKSNDVTDAQAGVPHQEHHGACGTPFVTATPNFITRCDDLDDLVARVWHHIIRFARSWNLKSPSRILGRPFAVPAELKQMPQKFDVLNPGSEFASRKGLSVQCLDIDLVQVDQGVFLAEVSEVAEEPLIPALGFIRVLLVLHLERLDGVEDCFAGLPR